MKKLYSILGLCALFAMPTFAQEEDVTHLIVNPGFDADLTFLEDGSTKEIVETGSLSSRSHKHVAADGTIYARSKTSAEGNGNWKRTDTQYSVNGFLGQIEGWTLETGSNGEWTYFGAVPYSLVPGSTYVGIADDNNDSWLTVAGKPEEADTEDNKATMYLRAGWTNYAAYSQVVKLPCAQYRLEYWINNMNFTNTNPDGLENLCKITCRKDVFADEEGVNADGWVKHTIEFTPTSEFTITMGFKSANRGSGTNPILLIDGMRLYKVGEADAAQLLQGDIIEYIDSINGLVEEHLSAFGGVSDEVAKKIMDFEDIAYGDDVEAMEQALKDIKAYAGVINDFIAVADRFTATIDKATDLVDAPETYPGIDALNAAIEAANETAETADMAGVAEGLATLNKAINTYYESQVATPDNPANYTHLVQNPEFCVTGSEPTYDESGVATYPNGIDYTAGTAPADATSEGWEKGSITSGDQRLNFAQGRICWNLWDNNPGHHQVSQTLTGIPNGYYTVSGDMITQPDFPNDQHMFAKSSTSAVVSENLTAGNWNDNNDGEWTTLTTEKIAVVDGKLTIGAASTFPEASAKGWFCLTHVVLKYYGKISDEEIAAEVSKKIAASKAYGEAMHLAADKAAFLEVANAANGVADLDTLNAALAIAEASEAEYEGVITGSYKNLQDSIATSYSANCKAVAQVPVDHMTNYLGSAEATYTETPNITAVTRYYRDTLIPALQKAEATEITNAEGKSCLESSIDVFVGKLKTYESDTEVLAGYIDELNAAVEVAKKADIEYGDGKDVTAYITNPNIDAITGWVANLIAGDGNGRKTSQQYDGDANGGYIDSYNATAGLLRATVYQVLNVPNGTYKVENIMRASGTGAYLFAADAVPAKNEAGELVIAGNNVLAEAVAPATDNKKYVDAAAEEEATVYTDSYGPIWTAAADTYMGLTKVTGAMEGTNVYELISDVTAGEAIEGYEKEWAILSANNGKGRGWFNNSVEIEVKDHVLVIGVSSDGIFTGKEQFSGSWFSADNFKLTMIKAGDNTGWNPTTAIEAVATEASDAAATQVYSITGARNNGIKNGINIVRYANGDVKKIMK